MPLNVVGKALTRTGVLVAGTAAQTGALVEALWTPVELRARFASGPNVRPEAIDGVADALTIASGRVALTIHQEKRLSCARRRRAELATCGGVVVGVARARTGGVLLPPDAGTAAAAHRGAVRPGAWLVAARARPWERAHAGGANGHAIDTRLSARGSVEPRSARAAISAKPIPSGARCARARPSDDVARAVPGAGVGKPPGALLAAVGPDVPRQTFTLRQRIAHTVAKAYVAGATRAPPTAVR